MYTINIIAIVNVIDIIDSILIKQWFTKIKLHRNLKIVGRSKAEPSSKYKIKQSQSFSPNRQSTLTLTVHLDKAIHIIASR